MTPQRFLLFLVGLFTLGLGLSLLQTATNPYFTVLGPTKSAAQRISIMGIANKVAGMLSSLLLATLLIKDMDAIEDQLALVNTEEARAAILEELS